MTNPEQRAMARNRVLSMLKPALVAEALKLGLGPSRAALDVHPKETLRRMVLDALNAWL